MTRKRFHPFALCLALGLFLAAGSGGWALAGGACGSRGIRELQSKKSDNIRARGPSNRNS